MRGMAELFEEENRGQILVRLDFRFCFYGTSGVRSSSSVVVKRVTVNHKADGSIPSSIVPF